MPEQYVATDKRTGLEVAVTGEFPAHPDDRVRIARTTTLFTRLMSTILGMSETERRHGFRAIETQLELADALIRQNLDEVRRLVRETMQSMGINEEQLEDLARQLRELGALDEQPPDEQPPADQLPDKQPPADQPPDDHPPPAAKMGSDT